MQQNPLNHKHEAVPSEVINFNGAVGEERSVQTKHGINILVVKISAARYSLGVLKAGSSKKQAIHVRQVSSTTDSTVSLFMSSADAVCIDASIEGKHDGVVVTMQKVDGGEIDTIVFRKDFVKGGVLAYTFTEGESVKFDPQNFITQGSA